MELDLAGKLRLNARRLRQGQGVLSQAPRSSVMQIFGLKFPHQRNLPGQRHEPRPVREIKTWSSLSVRFSH
eukprot:2200066-Amphidinium_carterae.1